MRALAVLAIVAGLAFATQALFIPAKAGLAQALLQRAWDQQATTGTPHRPWPWADFTPAARIDFPTQRTMVLALSDASGESFAFGPTLMAASAQPGDRGVTVFAAHRDTHFDFLGNLDPGERIVVETPDAAFTYEITGSEIVRWDASGIQPHDDGPPRIALVTSWPLHAGFRGSMRYVVWGQLVETAPSA